LNAEEVEESLESDGGNGDAYKELNCSSSVVGLVKDSRVDNSRCGVVDRRKGVRCGKSSCGKKVNTVRKSDFMVASKRSEAHQSCTSTAKSPSGTFCALRNQR
jgi:hypothetical protein